MFNGFYSILIPIIYCLFNISRLFFTFVSQKMAFLPNFDVITAFYEQIAFSSPLIPENFHLVKCFRLSQVRLFFVSLLSIWPIYRGIRAFS